MKLSPRCNWTFMIDNGRAIQCERCGETQQLKLPIKITRLVKVIDAFNVLHAECVETPAASATA